MTEKFFGILICEVMQRTSELPLYQPSGGGRTPIEHTRLEEIIETVLCVIVITFICVYLVYTIIFFFYKGREVRIFVVRKRKNLYKTYHWKHGTGTEEHYVVYAKYPNSNRVHTLACDGDIYRKLSVNKGYNVTVKLMWIKKVHREKLKSKKKR